MASPPQLVWQRHLYTYFQEPLVWLQAFPDFSAKIREVHFVLRRPGFYIAFEGS